MSDPRYPGSPSDPSQPGQSPQQQPTDWQQQQPAEWQSQQPTDPAWQPQQPTDPAWQPQQQPADSGWQPQQPTDPAWQPQQQWQPEGAIAVPPKKPRRQWIGAVALIVIVGLIAGAFFLFRDRVSNDVTSLRLGDCIDKPTTTDAVSQVQNQPCNEPHDGEVFALITHTAASGTAYPPSIAFDNLTTAECEPALENYTGRTLVEIDGAGLTYSYFYPTAGSWAEGDRGITCFVNRVDGQKMTGSVRSAAPPPSSAPAGSTSAPASP